MRKLILSLLLLALPASVQMAHSQSSAQAGARDTIEATQYWLAETEYIRAAVDQFSTPLIDAYQIMDAVAVGTISEKDANSTLTPLLETIDRHEALLLNAVNDVQEPSERGYSATSPSMTRAYLTQLVTSYATVNRLNLEYIIARVRQQDRAHQIFQQMYQETQANLLYDRQRMDLEIELLEANQMPRLPHPQVMVIELMRNFGNFGLTLLEMEAYVDGVEGMPDRGEILESLATYRSLHTSMTETGRLHHENWNTQIRQFRSELPSSQAALLQRVFDTYDESWAVEDEFTQAIDEVTAVFSNAQASDDELFEAFVLFGDAIYTAEVARLEVMQYRVSISAQ